MRARAKGRGGGAGFQPSHRSLSITYSQGKNARGRERSSHQQCTLKSNPSCYILHSRGPWQIISNATESQRAENEVRGNSFSSYNGIALKRRRRRRNLIQVLSADLSACDLKCLKESSVWAYGSNLFKYSPC